MGNLLIMTAALAMSAVLGLGGVYYGSDAIQGLRAKANAAQIIAQAQSLADAWREYAQNNNGSPVMADYAWGDGATQLDGKYITVQPAPPLRAVPSTAAFYYPIALKNYGTKCTGTALVTDTTPPDTIALQLSSLFVCQRITEAAGNSSIPQKTTAMLGDLTTASPKRPFDCLWYDADGDGTRGRGDTYLFIYRVFDQNNYTRTTSATCP